MALSIQAPESSRFKAVVLEEDGCWATMSGNY